MVIMILEIIRCLSLLSNFKLLLLITTHFWCYVILWKKNKYNELIHFYAQFSIILCIAADLILSSFFTYGRHSNYRPIAFFIWPTLFSRLHLWKIFHEFFIQKRMATSSMFCDLSVFIKDISELLINKHENWLFKCKKKDN